MWPSAAVAVVEGGPTGAVVGRACTVEAGVPPLAVILGVAVARRRLAGLAGLAAGLAGLARPAASQLEAMVG